MGTRISVLTLLMFGSMDGWRGVLREQEERDDARMKAAGIFHSVRALAC